MKALQIQVFFSLNTSRNLDQFSSFPTSFLPCKNTAVLKVESISQSIIKRRKEGENQCLFMESQMSHLPLPHSTPPNTMANPSANALDPSPLTSPVQSCSVILSLSLQHSSIGSFQSAFKYSSVSQWKTILCPPLVIIIFFVSNRKNVLTLFYLFPQLFF